MTKTRYGLFMHSCSSVVGNIGITVVQYQKTATTTLSWWTWCCTEMYSYD